MLFVPPFNTFDILPFIWVGCYKSLPQDYKHLEPKVLIQPGDYMVSR